MTAMPSRKTTEDSTSLSNPYSKKQKGTRGLKDMTIDRMEELHGWPLSTIMMGQEK